MGRPNYDHIRSTNGGALVAVSARRPDRSAPIELGLGSAMTRLRDDLGLDERGLAQALGVDRRTLARWSSGETYPQRDARARLQELAALHAYLGAMWRSRHAARRWLHRPSPFLGHAEPIDLVRAGRLDRVEAALEAINSGFAS